MFFEMPQLEKAIERAIEFLDKRMANKITTGGKYNQVKLMITKALNEREPFKINTTQEARLVFAVLSLEESILDRLFQANRFSDLIETAIKTSDRLAKSMLGFYYHKYDRLEKKDQKIYLVENLKLSLRDYTGRNPMVIKAKNEPSIMNGSLIKLLDRYGEIDIKEIKNDLYLSEDDEFYQRLRIIKIINELKKLKANENRLQLFQEINDNRDVSASNQRNLGEEATVILLMKCKSEGAIIGSEWINFILKVVGDPRSPQTQYAWDRIGEEFKNWLVSILSQGDLIEFLGSITDGQGDEIYQYRKAFWMQFVKYVKHAKIMVSSDGLETLRISNPNMHKRFNQNPTTYSKLDDANRSCIYMDFGSFKAIEGTHNAMIRFYNDCPISLNQRRYSYSEFHDTKQANEMLIFESQHRNSENYTWQNKILNFMNKNIGTRVLLEDIMLLSDVKHKAKIKNYLLQHNHEVKY